MSRGWRGIIEEYRDLLPIDAATEVVTLHEGATPLIESPELSKRTEARVFLKYEGLNPTGSFKDRGMTMAVTQAKADGARAVVCASTGNTSAAAAAYAARAGLSCLVLVPQGHIAMGKLSQALMHGAQVVQVTGNFDEALAVVRELSAEGTATIVNSINPFRIAGQRTASFEVVDVLGDAPDVQCMPVGNAGNISAYWAGYKDYATAGRSTRLPQMLGFQAAGSAPIVDGAPVDAPETVATAIRIGKPTSWEGAAAAATESKGSISAVTDDEILEAYDLVARTGVFCEPASAASIAGLLKSDVKPGSTVVCVLTGHGLKDPSLAVDRCPPPMVSEPTLKALKSIIA